MNINIKKIINRNPMDETDETYIGFLKKYWWIELLFFVKVIIFIDRGYYEYSFGILFLVIVLIVLWILYRIGLE